MLKWLTDKLDGRSTEQQLEDLRNFIEKLRVADDEDIAAFADMVSEYGIIFESKNINVLDPIRYVRGKPAIMTRFEEFATDLRKKNDQLKAVAVMVWLHTLRSAHAINQETSAYEFRKYCREMWKVLSRGFSEDSGTVDYPSGFGPDDA